MPSISFGRPNAASKVQVRLYPPPVCEFPTLVLLIAIDNTRTGFRIMSTTHQVKTLCGTFRCKCFKTVLWAFIIILLFVRITVGYALKRKVSVQVSEKELGFRLSTLV